MGAGPGAVPSVAGVSPQPSDPTEAPCVARNKKAHVSWKMGTILEGSRRGFGSRGPKERLSRELILKAKEGNYDWVHGVLRDDLASPNVADARGYSVLAAAAVSPSPVWRAGAPSLRGPGWRSPECVGALPSPPREATALPAPKWGVRVKWKRRAEARWSSWPWSHDRRPFAKTNRGSRHHLRIPPRCWLPCGRQGPLLPPAEGTGRALSLASPPRSTVTPTSSTCCWTAGPT